jgi:plasmid replication initiation protein
MSTDIDNVRKAPASSNVVVAKSNELVNAVYRLSLLEAQLLHFCIAWAREHQLGLSTDTPLRLRVSDFAERFGIGQDNAYRQTKDALEAMFQREVTMHSTDPETGLEKVTRTRWVSEYSYIDGAGVITVIFTPKVVEHITRLEKAFTSYSLTEIANFSSYYAVRLYELLMQFKDKGWRTISIEDLRAAFGLAPTEYKVMYELKRRTVDVAVAQINELTDWKVSYQNHKHGVKITGLTFNIKPKSKRIEKPAPLVPDDAYIARHARPGESWEAARKRLQADIRAGINHDQNDLLK